MKASKYLSLAAIGAMTFSGVAFAQQSSNPSNSRDTQSQVSGQADKARMSDAARESDSAEQQMLQQLKQIAQDPASAPDKLFVLDAAKCNLKEQKLAEQVEQKAQNDQVKQLARQIMQDHEKAQQQLQQVAQKMGLQLPQSLPQTEQVTIQIIASLPAGELDKHYVSSMNADHARDTLKYQCEAKMGKDDQAKQYAQATLPTLESHQQQTAQVAQALGLDLANEPITAGAKIPPEGGTSPRSSYDRSGDHSTNGSDRSK